MTKEQANTANNMLALKLNIRITKSGRIVRLSAPLKQGGLATSWPTNASVR